MAKPPDYGIIYNWDGAPHGYSAVPQMMEAFLEKVYSPMEDTQVGAHFWCVGDHHGRWKSDVMEMIGDSHGRKYENAHIYIHNENILAMLERGEDPQTSVIERGHKLGLHVYASVRMNDNHFDGLQVHEIPHSSSSDMTRMRIDHPEWLLGDQTSEWFSVSWNFAIPEVREHRYRHIEEVCRLYDWDGVELDWQRHAFHLPEELGYRMRYVLTDLQRAVRRRTTELGESRGRAYFVAARVSGSLEMCERIGYDVSTWVREGLVDILIPAAGASTDPLIDVMGFVDLCRGTNVVVYPGLDAQVPGNAAGPENAYQKDAMLNRGIANRFHQDGAHGIYSFNWHADRSTRRELLTQIGSPQTLRCQDKIYAATHRIVVKEGAWRGAFRGDRILGDVPVPLKQTLTADGPTANIDIADDVQSDSAERIELRVRLDQWVDGDVVNLLWDGQKIDDPKIQYDIQTDQYANPFAANVSDVGTAVWITSELSSSQSRIGRHRVKVVLEKRNPKVACDIILTDVEVVISYPHGPG